MHIEPGLVDGAKIWLSYATAAGAGGLTIARGIESLRNEGVAPTALRSLG